MNNNELITKKTYALFFKYLLPSVGATLFVSIYIITDTMMIGHGVGNEGLVALNILLPVFSFIFSIGYLFGVGGSVLMSVAKGVGDKKRADGLFTTSCVVTFVIGGIFTVIFSVFAKDVSYMLGADQSNIDIVMEYAGILYLSLFILIMVPVLQNFVKNDKAPSVSMTASIVGSVLNVVLDYVFIFPLGMGMKGAIAATVIGNITNALICLSHMAGKNNTMHFDLKLIKLSYIPEMFTCGISSALTEISNGIVILVFNYQILRYIGSEGIVIYSVISNSMIAVIALINGVAGCSQPVISYNYGADRKDRIHELRRIGFAACITVSAAMMIFMDVKADICVKAFVEDADAIMSDAVEAIRKYTIGTMLMGINIFYACYYQAVVKGGRSFLIGLMRGLVLSIFYAFLLPPLFGSRAIWYTIPLTEATTLLITMGYVAYDAKKKAGV